MRRDDSYNVPILPLGRHIYGFPEKLVTKLKYAEILQITSTAGGNAGNIFNINSTFDPNQSGIGHQPLYRDTYAAIYDQYAVISATAKVTFISNATTSAMIVGVVIDDDSSISSTIETLIEQSTSQTHLIPNATGALNNHTFNISWSAKKHLGIDPFTSESYKTAVGSNPSEISTLAVFAKPADGSSTTTTTVLVEIIQTVLFTELTTPVQS